MNHDKRLYAAIIFTKSRYHKSGIYYLQVVFFHSLKKITMKLDYELNRGVANCYD